MLSRLSSRLAGRLMTALLVLTIAFHAGTPVAAAFEQRSGSAFSADTVEMAVAPARRDVAATRMALQPVLPALALPPPVAAGHPPVIAAPGHLHPDPTGPPLQAAPLARHIAPRGPPAA